jgi:hypothetical protein
MVDNVYVRQGKQTTNQESERQMENEIIKALKTFGPQLVSVMTYSFGPDFGPAIKKLHNQGKVESFMKNGKKMWKAN